MYAAMGLAVLAKGPVGVVLPVVAIGAFVLFEGSRLRQSTGSVSQQAATFGRLISFAKFFAMPSVTLALFQQPAGRTPSQLPPARPEFGTLGGLLLYYSRWMLWRLRCAAREFPAAVVAMRPLTLILTVLAVALPWYAWVAVRTHGVWWHDFFWEHNVQRFMASREGHHGWFLFPPLTLMAFFFPWSLILPVALATVIRRLCATGSASVFVLASAAGSGHWRSQGRDEGSAAACRLLLWWSAAWIVFFSICGTKQPNYIVPAYPALAVLVGLWIADWIAAPQRISGPRFLAAFWSAIGLNGVGLAAALVIIAHWFPETARFSWIGLIPIVGAGCAWYFARRHIPRLAMASVVASTALLLATVLGGVAVPLSREQNGVRLGEYVAQLQEPPSKIGQFRLSFVGLTYYANRKVEELATPDDAAALFAGGEHPLVVTDQVGFEQMSALLPGELQIVDEKQRFCRPSSMVLVARSPSDIADRQVSSTTRLK
jgi:4-amino-4-deoxy-L-arabinose transferase-like glycosyltransferase